MTMLITSSKKLHGNSDALPAEGEQLLTSWHHAHSTVGICDVRARHKKYAIEFTIPAVARPHLISVEKGTRSRSIWGRGKKD